MKQLLKALEFILDKPKTIVIPIKKEYFKDSEFMSNTDCALSRGIKETLGISNKEFASPNFRVGGTTVIINSISYNIKDNRRIIVAYHYKIYKDFNVILTKIN